MTEEQKTSNSEGSFGGLSFGFSKKISSKPKFTPKQEENEEKDYIKDVQGGKITGSKPVKEKVDLVIPCTGNRINFAPKLAVKSEEKVKSEAIDKDQDEATRELLNDAQKWEEDRENEVSNGVDPNFVVPLNEKVDDKEFLDADVASRAEGSSLEDYESIPVEGFGMGMLRGMGFKENVGIGGFKQKAVSCIEPVIRPKGLGLGAARPSAGDKNKKGGSGSKEGDEDLVLAKGGFVQIERGAHKNSYGQVEGLDEETARVIVRLAVGGQVVSVSENVVRVVTKKEYKEFGRVLNKDSYEKYRDKQKEREAEWNRDRSRREIASDESDSRKKRRSRSRTPDKKYRSEDKRSDQNGKKKERTWLRPFLRVRVIDKNFKSGKYYNTKVVVEDVTSNEYCIARTESGSLLENILNSKCESVIPKADLGIVMVVRGSCRGNVGEILSRDKRSSRALVQILPDKEEVLKLDYDDICEYVGDISHLL